jgi:hypothetical protein
MIFEVQVYGRVMVNVSKGDSTYNFIDPKSGSWARGSWVWQDGGGSGRVNQIFHLGKESRQGQPWPCLFCWKFIASYLPESAVIAGALKIADMV